MKALLLLTFFFVYSALANDISWMYKEVDKDTNNFTGNVDIEYHCPRPIKITQVNDNRDVTRYNNALHKYKSCIDTFQSKYTKLYNEETDPEKRLIIAKALEKSQRDWISYDTLDDVEQNQKILATFKALSAGYEEQKEPKKK